MIFADLIRDLSERLGLETAIEVDADNRFDFEVDGTVVMVQGMNESSSLAFFADLGQPPPERLEGLYLELLKANHLLRDTRGATLSVDPATSSVVLCRILPLNDQTAESLERALEQFIMTLLSWREKVREFRGEKSYGSKKPEAMTDEGFIQV